MPYTNTNMIKIDTVNTVTKNKGLKTALYIPCAAGTRRYYVIAQETVIYPRSYETGVTPIKKSRRMPWQGTMGNKGKEES